MRKRDSSGSGSGRGKKPAGRSGARSNSPRSSRSGSSSRSRDDRDDSKPRRSSGFSGRSGDSKDFSKPRGGKPAGRTGGSFGRSKDSGYSSRGEKPFSRSRDDRDESRRSPGFSREGKEGSKDFSKPRGGKTFGRSKDSGYSRSRDDRDDERPRRSKFAGEDDSKEFSRPRGGKTFGRSRDDREDERPSRSKFAGEGDSRDFKPRGGKTFGRDDERPRRSDDREEKPSRSKYSRPSDNQRPSDDRYESRSRRNDKFERGDRDKSEKSDKKGFFSKLSRGGKSFERRHDSDFGKSVKDFAQNKEEAKEASEGSDKIRLNRYISNSGVCSRREADELIKMGLVSVNGTVITEMGHKVGRKDVVKYDGKTLRAEKPVYILMNKPKGFLTTTKDPEDRNTVMQIIAGAVKERVYPVGRLDRNTTGLLLLTNDGDLTDKLSHPSYNVKKIYKVELDKPLTKADFQKIKDGVQLEEGRAMVDDLAIVSDDGKTVGIEIHIGWNRVIRRIFERLEYQVVKLDRSVYAGLDKKDLSRGHWRYLTNEEVVRLKHYK